MVFRMLDEEKQESQPIEAETDDTNHATSQKNENQSLKDHDHVATSRSPSAVIPAPSMLEEYAFLSTMILSHLLTQASVGQAIAPLSIIGSSFGIHDPGTLSWYAAAYSLTVGTFILPAGRLGDMVGHRGVFVAGFAVFALWSLLAGAAYHAGSSVFFAVCRAGQGIGPALLLPNALALIGRRYPPGLRRNMAFSLFGACAPGGFALGATFASLFAQEASWQWAYWTMGVVCAGLAVGSLWTVPPPSDGEDERGGDASKAGGEAERFDYIGALTGVVSLVLINFAWNQGPTVGWGTPYVYTLLIAGLLFFGAFLVVESRVAAPLVPVGALNVRVCFVLASLMLCWASFGVWIFYLFQFLEELRGASPLLAMAYNAPSALTGLLASVTTGFLMGRLRTAYIMVLASLAFSVGLILLATMPVDQTYWAQTFVSVCVTPWGMDMSFPAGTIILSSSVPKQHQGIAASLVLTVVNYSISIGLGVAGTVIAQVDPEQTNLFWGIRCAWYAGTAMSVTGVLVALAGALYDLRYPLSTNHH